MWGDHIYIFANSGALMVQFHEWAVFPTLTPSGGVL
jgi:hypothetical protein